MHSKCYNATHLRICTHFLKIVLEHELFFYWCWWSADNLLLSDSVLILYSFVAVMWGFQRDKERLRADRKDSRSDWDGEEIAHRFVFSSLLTQTELWDQCLTAEVLIPPNLLKLIRSTVRPLTVNLLHPSIAGSMGGKERGDVRETKGRKNKWGCNFHQD